MQIVALRRARSETAEVFDMILMHDNGIGENAPTAGRSSDSDHSFSKRNAVEAASQVNDTSLGRGWQPDSSPPSTRKTANRVT
jgi:hypothetical protein